VGKTAKNLSKWLDGTPIFLAAMLIMGLILLMVYIAVIYTMDITQAIQVIRSNHPFIG